MSDESLYTVYKGLKGYDSIKAMPFLYVVARNKEGVEHSARVFAPDDSPISVEWMWEKAHDELTRKFTGGTDECEV